MSNEVNFHEIYSDAYTQANAAYFIISKIIEDK